MALLQKVQAARHASHEVVARREERRSPELAVDEHGIHEGIAGRIARAACRRIHDDSKRGTPAPVPSALHRVVLEERGARQGIGRGKRALRPLRQLFVQSFQRRLVERDVLEFVELVHDPMEIEGEHLRGVQRRAVAQNDGAKIFVADLEAVERKVADHLLDVLLRDETPALVFVSAQIEIGSLPRKRRDLIEGPLKADGTVCQPSRDSIDVRNARGLWDDCA